MCGKIVLAQHHRIPRRHSGSPHCWGYRLATTQSSSIEYRSKLAKTGNAHLRRSLYFAAITPIRQNPPIREFAERLRACGKTKMTVVAAAIRKLLTLAYGVLKSGRPFAPSYAIA
jgi:transposase